MSLIGCICAPVLVQQDKRNVTPCLFDKGKRCIVGIIFLRWKLSDDVFPSCTQRWIFHPIIVLKATKTPEDASDCGLKVVSESRGRTDWHYRLRIMSSVGKDIMVWQWLQEWWEDIPGLVSLETSCGNITLMPFSNHVSWLKILRAIAGSVEQIRNRIFFLWMRHLCGHLGDVICS